MCIFFLFDGFFRGRIDDGGRDGLEEGRRWAGHGQVDHARDDHASGQGSRKETLRGSSGGETGFRLDSSHARIRSEMIFASLLRVTSVSALYPFVQKKIARTFHHHATSFRGSSESSRFGSQGDPSSRQGS